MALLIVLGCSKRGNVFSLEVGQCFEDSINLTATEVQNVNITDCKNPHLNEVYEVTELPAGNYPLLSIERTVAEICYDAFELYVGEIYEYSIYEIGAIWPTKESWEKANDREITCYLYDMQEKLKLGTAANSGL